MKDEQGIESNMAHHGFHLERDEIITELQASARIYRHVRTGAQLLSISKDDENKVFGIAFRTPPEDSTGLPHILEHSVLGGSQKYQVKEPFLELVKGSLKTFLNAMTYPDKTVYPVASTNLKDFYNLVDVYLDAVFFPLLTPQHLQQEGWHYEVNSGNTSGNNSGNGGGDGPALAYKGVVFNEMKGAYSSPETLLFKHGLAALHPDTPYRHDSGGDPAAIPNLTYEQFVAFHRRYYHPSNALIYFYGDDDPEERLRLLDVALSRFDAQPVDAQIPLQRPFSAAQRQRYAYSVDDEPGFDPATARKTLLRVQWLLPENRDPALAMALSVLGYALIGTQASPLRKALTDSGLGEDVNGGLSAGLRQMSFSAGMKNIAATDAERVETLTLETLRGLVETGFDPELVEAALNTIEFHLREQNTGGYPRGLSMMMDALSTWLYGGDPLAPLAYEAPLAAVKQWIAEDPRYLQRLIYSYLLSNPHRVTVLLEPEPGLNARRESEERARLAAAQAQMTPADLEALAADAEELRRRQAAPDDPAALAALPMLALDDLDRRQRTIPTAGGTLAGATVLHHDLFTNGIVYLDLAWDMHRVPQELLPYVTLFGRSLTEIGTEREDFVKLSQRIGRKTGGIGASPLVMPAQRDPAGAAWLLLRGKSTPAHAEEMLAIMRDILLTVKLDNRDRFKQMVLKNKARMEAGLVPGGNQVVSGRLHAPFSTAGWAAEQIGGLGQLFFLRELTAAVDEDWPGVLAKLEATRAALLDRAGMVANVTLDAAAWDHFRPQLEEFLGELPLAANPAAPWQPPAYPAHEGLTIPAQINYVGKGANLYDAGYRFHGSMHVAANLIRTGWLWNQVRVQGGAYGAFCSFSKQTGVFAYGSYRDPNLLATLAAYDQTAAFLEGLDLSETELTRGIIGAISSFDPYQLPDAKGFTALVRHWLGETDESVQQTREEILGTTVADIKALAPLLRAAAERGRVVVMGAPEAVQEASAARKGWLTVQKVL